MECSNESHEIVNGILGAMRPRKPSSDSRITSEAKWRAVSTSG